MVELGRKFDQLKVQRRAEGKPAPSWGKFLEREQKSCQHDMSMGRDAMDNPSHSRCHKCGYTEWFR